MAADCDEPSTLRPSGRRSTKHNTKFPKGAERNGGECPPRASVATNDQGKLFFYVSPMDASFKDVPTKESGTKKKKKKKCNSLNCISQMPSSTTSGERANEYTHRRPVVGDP